MNNPTAFFRTVGCRLNQAETAKMAADLELAGFTVLDTMQPCDVAIINSCTITHQAERDTAKIARRLKREGARLVVLAGCAAEHNGPALQSATGADLTIPQAQKDHLPAQLHQHFKLGSPTPASPVNATPKFTATRALVKVQDGCDFRCSYCIVPETRGAPTSRPMRSIIREVEQLLDEGYREIGLTGANLGCYQDGHKSLIHLLEAVENLDELGRFRIGSIESTTVEREIINYMAQSAKLCRFLHLPLQSGDDITLKNMRRRYTVAQYRATAELAASSIDQLALGTDVICGFPGETPEAFTNTKELITELPFSNLHVFSYSPRQGTPAASMNNQIDEATKKKRTRKLIEIGRMKRKAFAASFVDQEVTTLIEKIDQHGNGNGWTEQYIPAIIHADNLQTNQLFTSKVTRLNDAIQLYIE